MKIVIDVPEKVYNHFCRGCRFFDEVEEAIIAITDGTLLPKGHGRLIDADALKKYIDDGDCCVGCENESYGCADRCKCPDYLDEATERIINNQPTVIEADTAEEDKS